MRPLTPVPGTAALPSSRPRTAMPTASLAKAALSAAAVGLLLAVLRHAGPRAGGGGRVGARQFVAGAPPEAMAASSFRFQPRRRT